MRKNRSLNNSFEKQKVSYMYAYFRYNRKASLYLVTQTPILIKSDMPIKVNIAVF